MEQVYDDAWANWLKHLENEVASIVALTLKHENIIESGATHNFMREDVAREFGLKFKIAHTSFNHFYFYLSSFFFLIYVSCKMVSTTNLWKPVA